MFLSDFVFISDRSRQGIYGGCWRIAATISSRAYVDAVVRAYNAVQQVKGGANVATGATSNSTEWSEGEPAAEQATAEEAAETVNEETQKGEDNE